MPKANANANANADDDFEGKTEAEIRAEVVAEIAARNKQVTALCRIAGKPELAAKFNDDGKTAEEVMTELDTLAKADAEKAKAKKPGQRASGDSEISARHTGSGEDAPVVIDSAKIYDRWNGVKSRAA